MKRLSIILVLLAQYLGAIAANVIEATASPSAEAVDLSKASIVYDTSDAIVVDKAAGLLAQDIKASTGTDIKLNPTKTGKQLIIIGTVGHSKCIDNLVKAKRLDVSGIEGGWERFMVKSLDKPMKGVDRALVIAGSDRRGTAYGVFALSEALGVNPWYWWADVPVQKHDRRYVRADYTSSAPSVKYRGIFINDEDWGLKTWSALNYEKELGDIGPRTYARVCELLLRLRANMLAPAMHSCTGAFYSHPESKVVADSFAIIITTSHCEPLLLNNAAKEDWDTGIDGPWDYGRNPEGIRARWNRRLDEAAAYENIYTMAMRGLHDEGLRGNYTMEEKVPLIERVITDQRNMLTDHTGKQPTDIPQIFVPYKETMDLYENGLKVPDDVTLVWVDDNYGYMKRVSSPDEQRRAGASGVYYHTSYLGAPHDYLWLNTTPPTLMYAELKKAYDTGADRYWLLNVGDIKPCELGMTTFFDLAWDVDAFCYDNINRHQGPFIADVFGINPDDAQWLMDEYYRLAWSRKPEFMGWEREWDFKELESLADTEYSFDNYNDAQQRLADYMAISDRANALLQQLPQDYQAAFFEMVAYPAMASCQMNRKFLMAQLNHELHVKGDYAGANWAAAEAKAAFDSIQALNDRYNTLLDGKWAHMMALAPGWCAKYQNMPEVTVTPSVAPSPSRVCMVDPAKDVLQGCAVIDLSKCAAKSPEANVIEGIGYDWRSIQLGNPVGKYSGSVDVKYNFSTDTPCDSVEVTVYTLPLWPVYKGKSTRLGVAVDSSEMAVFANEPKEYSPEWKTQVLQNAAVYTAKFPVGKHKAPHTLTLRGIDPGTIVQRILIDWGGLKSTYVGPSKKVKSEK